MRNCLHVWRCCGYCRVVTFRFDCHGRLQIRPAPIAIEADNKGKQIIAMFPTLSRRLAAASKEPLLRRAPLSVVNNPYKARKVWPPDFKQLNPQQQLRFEKKYKRRILLANYSPRWVKGVKFAQLVTIVGKQTYPLNWSLNGFVDPRRCSHLSLVLLRV